MPSNKTVVVLIPGAWHDPAFAFSANISSLASLSIKCIPLDLPSCAPANTGPRKGLEEDVELIVSTITTLADEGNEVVVVCHSYGGFPAAQGLNGLGVDARKKEGKDGGVKRLIYMAAFMVPENLTLKQAVGGNDLPWWDVQDDVVYPLTPEVIFYNDVEKETADKFIKELRPFSYKCFSSPLTYCAWKDIPTSYLLCENDQALPYVVQQQLVQSAGLKDEDIVTCDAGHSPFISRPDVVLKLIKKAVEE